MIRFPGNLSIYLRMKGKEGETKWQQNVIYMKVLGISKTADEKTIKKDISETGKEISSRYESRR